MDNVKVLIVDDNLINRKVAAGFLKSYGFELFEAESGPQAIEMVRETRFDFIFMDYMMPDMDGIEATRIIRGECGANGLAPVIIALTANSVEGEKETFLKNGFQAFLAKPLEPRAVDNILKRWLAGNDKDGMEMNEAEGEVSFEQAYRNISIQGIDTAEARKYHSGSLEDYLELLELYSIDGRRKVPFLSELLRKQDYHNYEIEVHGLKSTSAKLGALRLSEQAREHEEAAERGDYDFISLHFAELISCYDALLKDIARFLDASRASRGSQAAGGEGKDEAVDRQSLQRGVRSALESLESFRSKECAGKVEELLQYKLDSETEMQLKAVMEQLKMYEDDEAERLLRDLAGRLK